MNPTCSVSDPDPESQSEAQPGARTDTLQSTDTAAEQGPTQKPGSEPEDEKQAEPEPEPEPELPPLTPQEFRVYNRLAEQMEYFVRPHLPPLFPAPPPSTRDALPVDHVLTFHPPLPKQHDHFRQMYTTLQTACTNRRRPAGMSLRQFLDEGLRLARYLEMHHSIEETHLYPLLGRKMPAFRSSASPFSPSSGGGKKGKGKGKGGKDKESCELLRQHQVIHDGMDEMADYLRRCKDGECEFELAVLKEKLDVCGDVLLAHLDQEVADLGAERMRKYFTLQEMKAIPM